MKEGVNRYGMTKEVILQALKEANKFGYHNMEVVDYLEPETAADSPYLRLAVQPIVPRDATELHPLEL